MMILLKTMGLAGKDAHYWQRHVCALHIVLLVLFKHLPAAVQQGTFILS
jgi:hypothetical protein